LAIGVTGEVFDSPANCRMVLLQPKLEEISRKTAPLLDFPDKYYIKQTLS
jgi:hypothetical protein